MMMVDAPLAWAVDRNSGAADPTNATKANTVESMVTDGANADTGPASKVRKMFTHHPIRSVGGTIPQGNSVINDEFHSTKLGCGMYSILPCTGIVPT